MALSKKQISLIRSLGQKKYRYSEGLFVVEGEKVVAELLNSTYQVKEIFAVKEYTIPVNKSIELTEVTAKELKQISQLKSPNKVLAVAVIPENTSGFRFTNQLTIALHELNDPGNLGTIIRTADWFGVTQILCSQNSVDAFNPKVIQASMGSVFRVKVRYCDLEKELNKTNVPVFAASMEGENIYDCKLPKEGLLLFGSESHGVPHNLLQLADKVISIPKKGQAESLNVGVAVGLVCGEFGK